MLKMRTVELAVGALVIAGIVSLLMLALQVSGLSHCYRGNSGYKVRAEFSNIGGLKVRAKVSVAGVTVGRVIEIRLDPHTFNAMVLMSIDPSRSQKIPLDTQARIMTFGLLGDNYISLIPGFSETEFLREGSLIPLENTHSALVLEELVSKFVAGKATEETKEDKVNKPNPEAQVIQQKP